MGGAEVSSLLPGNGQSIVPNNKQSIKKRLFPKGNGEKPFFCICGRENRLPLGMLFFSGRGVLQLMGTGDVVVPPIGAGLLPG